MKRPKRPSRSSKRAEKRGPRRVLVISGAALLVLIVSAVVLWVIIGGSPTAPVVQEVTSITQAPPPPPAPRPTDIVTFNDGCMTAECHGPMGDREHVHMTLAEHACDLCHAPDTGGHIYPRIGDNESLCTSCHNTADHGTFQHKAMSDDSCMACHDPHGSSTRALLIADSVADTCQSCHPRPTQRSQHEPYASGECGACHDPHGADNRSLLLGGDGAEQCTLCHGQIAHDVASLAYTHREVEGSCLACHDPHASDYDGMQPMRTRDLCLSCHEDVAADVTGAVVSHDPILEGDRCITCHEPHASSHEHMLREEQADICLACHDKPVIAHDGRTIPELATTLATSPVVHGAIREGDCSACHTVHGGTHNKLLRSMSSDLLVGPFDLANYSMCFACHDHDLAEDGANTLFRDGDINLHQLHLRSGKTLRSCAECHAAHAGELPHLMATRRPRLIASDVNFQGSGWKTPMGFEMTEFGGRCSPGCHEPLGYSRQPGGIRGAP